MKFTVPAEARERAPAVPLFPPFAKGDMMKKGLIMTGLIVGVIVVVGVLLFLRKAAFIPGVSQGVTSPDKAFVAMFGTRTEKKPFSQPQTSYEIAVEMTIPGGSLELFKASINQSAALHDLKSKNVEDIVKWSADSAEATFYVKREPTVVKVKELASRPEIQKIIQMRQQTGQ